MADAQPMAEWFASSLHRPGGVVPFLEEVRALAPEALGSLSRAEDTADFNLAGDLLLIDVAGVVDRPMGVTLQVLWRDHVLAGCWGRRPPLGHTARGLEGPHRSGCREPA